MCVNMLSKYKSGSCLGRMWLVTLEEAVWIPYLEGVMGVRSRPMVWMTLRPHTHSPMQMPTPPYRRSQMGVGWLEVTLLLV